MKMRSMLFGILPLLVLLSGWACSGKAAEPEEVPLQSRLEARELVKRNLQEPIPDNYVIPTYIKSGLPLRQVYDTLAKRYPMFYGFQGEQYLDSIVRHPRRYLELSKESKAIRRYYDPNSRY